MLRPAVRKTSAATREFRHLNPSHPIAESVNLEALLMANGLAKGDFV